MTTSEKREIIHDLALRAILRAIHRRHGTGKTKTVNRLLERLQDNPDSIQPTTLENYRNSWFADEFF